MSDAKQVTLGIQGLPGLRWLDTFMQWPAYARLPFMTVASFVILFVPAFLGAPLKQSAALLASVIMAGTTMAVIVILARGAQADLSAAGAIERLEGLRPSRRQVRIEFCLSVISGFVALLYFGHVMEVGALSWLNLLAPDSYRQLGFGNFMNDWLLAIFIWLSGLLIGYAVATSWRQLIHFNAWAESFTIDLMHTEECQVFTMQPLRYLLIVVIFSSLNIMIYQVLTSIGFGDEVLVALMPLLLLMIAFAIPFLGPVAVIRRRIASSKQSEIDAVRLALKGDRTALDQAQIAPIASEFAAPDLLMYEQYVRNIWEWPVQGFVQRILLYVLLPPLAWVLAALVERLVDGVVG